MATPDGELPAATVEKWTGLYRNVGRFAISPGAMQVAQNVVLPGGSLMQPRRGFYDAADFPSYFEHLSTIGFYGDSVVMFAGIFTDGRFATLTLANATDPTIGFDISRDFSDLDLEAGSLAAVGFQVPAASTFRSFFTSNGNLYIPGVNFGMASVNLPPTPEENEGWAPAGMDTPVIQSVSSAGAGTLLPGLGLTVDGITYTYGSSVAYRGTYRWEDDNGNVHRSAPSEKMSLTNTTGTTVNVSVTFSLTQMVRPGTVLEVWRTATVPTPSDSSDATGDECFKVYERALNTGADFTTNSATGYLKATGTNSTMLILVGDSTPNTPYLVEPLYTNPTTGQVNGLGIGNANVMPPVATDCFQFKGYTYFANTQEVQRVRVQIIGTGGGGIVDGDTFSVDGINYQWKDTGSATPGFVKVQLWRTGGSLDAGSIIQNLYQSARAAAAAINISSGLSYGSFANPESPNNALSEKLRANAVWVNGLPGYINVERLVPNGVAFSFTAGTGSGRGWAGLLAVANTSDPNRQPNGLMQSQFNDPESVPPSFTELVGHEDSSILRGVPLRDTCLLYKQAPDGLWKFTDDGNGNLTIASLDATVNLVAPRTAVFLDNASFALCDKGVLKVTDGGSPENVSDEKVRADLAALMAHVGPTTLFNVAYGIAYEAEKLYILCLPTGPNSVACDIQYVYNLLTDSWTVWTVPGVTCGGVSPYNSKLYVGRDNTGSSGTLLWGERKDQSDTDFQDPEISDIVVRLGGGSSPNDTLIYTGDMRAEVRSGYHGFAQGDRIVYETGGVSYYAYVDSVTYAGATNKTTVTLSASLPFVEADPMTLQKAVQSNFTLLPLVDGDPLFDKQWQDVYLYYRYITNDRLLLSYGSNRQQVPTEYPLPGPVDTAWYDDDFGWGELPWGGAAQDVVLKLGMDQAAARGVELTLGVDMARACAGWQISAIRVPYVPTTRKAVR